VLSAMVWSADREELVLYPSVLITSVGLLVRLDESKPFEVLVPYGSGRISEINGEGDELVEEFVQFRPDLVTPVDSGGAVG
jgi:hypothetical protein